MRAPARINCRASCAATSKLFTFTLTFTTTAGLSALRSPAQFQGAAECCCTFPDGKLGTNARAGSGYAAQQPLARLWERGDGAGGHPHAYGCPVTIWVHLWPHVYAQMIWHLPEYFQKPWMLEVFLQLDVLHPTDALPYACTKPFQAEIGSRSLRTSGGVCIISDHGSSGGGFKDARKAGRTQWSDQHSQGGRRSSEGLHPHIGDPGFVAIMMPHHNICCVHASNPLTSRSLRT